MSTDTVLATVTLTKRLPDRRSFSATAQLHQLAGNARPYFSVTAEERNLRRRGDNQIESCGQMTDETIRHFPEMAPLVAIHLADDNGRPMHAVENGAYWLGLGDPRYVPDNVPDLGAFARLWRISAAEARKFCDYARADNHPTEALQFLARAEMAPRWAAEARDALALIGALAARVTS